MHTWIIIPFRDILAFNDMSCPYKNLFGAPGTGVHSLRIADIAVVDTVMTVIAAFGISKWSHQEFWIVLLVLFVIGEFMHYWFCVDTALLRKFVSLTAVD